MMPAEFCSTLIGLGMNILQVSFRLLVEFSSCSCRTEVSLSFLPVIRSKSLQSYQQCLRVPISPQPHYHLFVDLLLANSHSHRWVFIINQCWILFQCAFLWLHWASFICLLTTCVSSLEKGLFSFSAHFLIEVLVFLVLNCMCTLYILHVNPWLDVWRANIFSQLLDSLFILFMDFFAVQNILVFSPKSTYTSIRA